MPPGTREHCGVTRDLPAFIACDLRAVRMVSIKGDQAHARHLSPHEAVCEEAQSGGEPVHRRGCM